MKGSASMRHAERFIESDRRDASPQRRGVLLLVVLSMLTLFLLLGVTYLVLAARVRSTSKAFLRLADDQSHDSVVVFPLLRRAAMQVIRGAPSNARSVIKGHDLLADKYANSTQCVRAGAPALTAGGQLLAIPVSGVTADVANGCVLTFTGGAPASIANTSARVVHAQQNGATCTLYVARPAGLLPGDNVTTIQSVLINGRDFSGDGFSQTVGSGGSTMTLDNAALLPNPHFSVPLGTPHEDYDAIDEQNWALAPANRQPEKSFQRPAVLNHWTLGLDPSTLRATAVSESQNPSKTGAQLDSDLLPLRRSTLRPFAFDHWQDTTGGTDFTGKSLATFAVISNGTEDVDNGDVDNDGDGVVDSVWLDLGESTVTLRDGTTVKPLFAIHCVDLGGRINVNAHGSPTQLNESSVVNDSRLAADRGAAGSTKKLPANLRAGLGFGPADIRLDAVLNADDVAAVMLGSDAPGGIDDGIRRDLPPVVGRYGDGVATASAPAFPGQPATNDRRGTNPATLWTDRGVPDQYWPKNGTPSLFGGNPPDFWARLSVGIDHRGQPLYLFRNSAVSSEATDNPYELDLFRAKPSDSYSGNSVSWVDQPITAPELEAVLRPFDIDDAAGLPPRALAMALSGNGGQLDLNRASITSESWDTPAVISTDLAGLFTASDHDPDLVAGLKMDLNRPMGDGADSDNPKNKIVDEPGEANDPYSAIYQGGWLLTRGITPSLSQPGPNEPHLRARQLFALNLFNLLKTIRTKFAATASENALRLFAVRTDTDSSTPPIAVDGSLNSGGIGDTTLQEAHNDKVLAQWAVNVVDFLDADAIMTPFRFSAGLGTSNVVWGCEFPDLMISETLAFHDRRTADTKCDTTRETTVDSRNQYQAKYNTWMAWNNVRTGPQPPYPDPMNPDLAATPDDLDFDQVRIPEGSLFIELYGTRSPTTPNLPQELYSFVNGKWYLDVGRSPKNDPDAAPVWRLSVSTNRTAKPNNDVFAAIGNQPDTLWLSPGTNKNQVADTIDIDRYIWLSTAGASTTALPARPVSGQPNGPNRDNTFYVQSSSALGNPLIQPGGYFVVGPRTETALGSIQDGTGTQKWGAPSKQKITLQQIGSSSAPAIGVTDLTGEANPSPTLPNPRPFGNPLPPPADRSDVTATWVAMDPPTTGVWSSWTSNMKGVGKFGIGLNVSEPLRNAYYACPTTKNPINDLYDAYGALDDDTHTNFLPAPLDQSGPLAANMLSGGTYANFCTVFVERLADPTKPHEPDATRPAWNPYIVMDFMPVDLTVFNGESATPDPSETQGVDRGLAGPIPYAAPFPQSPADPLPPSNVPLPIGGASQLAVRQTFFHTRQRGFGKDLPNYDNDQTLFGTGGGKIYRNLHPFKPNGSLDDIRDTPLATSAAGTDILPGGKPTQPRSASDLSASEKAYFLHELGQSPGSRANPSTWQAIPYHSLGWVNSSFGRRLDLNDGVPADYVGSPDRPFPWIVWNDRPFANPYELLYVPRTPPGRLFTNYRNLDYPKGTSPDPVPYPNATSSTYNADDLFAACTPGSHLLPISSITDVPASVSTRTRNADLFVRLFEYVRVRSPFTGTETVMTGIGDNNDGRPDRFVGPFNRLPRYREPGKINLNTIDARSTGVGPQIWNALCCVDKNGTAIPSYSTALEPKSPFRTTTTNASETYVRPFRIARGTRTDYGAPSRGYANTLFPQAWAPASPADRLAPRSFTLFGDTSGPNPQSLFAPPPFESCGNDGAKNAWFRFDPLIRANANSSVRSEVYAIWVTMGLFEVEAMNVTNQRYPDGYRLVREYGSNTGEINRHRAFYIFDRSIPVGYQTGADVNIQDAILVERFIE